MPDDDNITIGPVRDADTGEIETPASETGSGDGQGLGEENFDGDDVSSFDPKNDTDDDPDPEPEPEPDDTGGDSDGTPTAIVAGDPGSTDGVQTVGEGSSEAQQKPPSKPRRQTAQPSKNSTKDNNHNSQRNRPTHSQPTRIR